MTEQEFIVMLVTAPDEKTAEAIARELVEERLAACVNITSGIRSIYRWEEKIEDAGEVLMLIKTRGSMFGPLADAIKRLHPYSVPEIIALPITDGSEEYLRWIGETTSEETLE